MADETKDIEFTEVTGEEGATGLQHVCKHCEKEYKAKTKRSVFCSDKCRALYGHKHKQMKGTPTDETTIDDPIDDDDKDFSEDYSVRSENKGTSRVNLNASLRGLDAQSQYIISHQETSIQKLAAKNSRLEDKLERMTRERDDLRRQMDKIELEQKFDVAGKSGLNGISQNPVVLKLVEHAAPALGAWLEKIVSQPSPSQLTGTENLPQEVQTQIVMIGQWYGQLPPEVQKEIFNMIDTLADVEDIEKLKKLLSKIQTTIKINGTASTNGHQAMFHN